MKNETTIIETPGYYSYYDKNSFTSYSTAPATSSVASLSGVVTSVNPKPWNRSMISAHAYTKYRRDDKGFYRQQSGIYNEEPWAQTQMDYGPISSDATSVIAGTYDTSGVDDRCLEKLLEAVRGEHANLAVDLAEVRQTIKMLRNATKFTKLVGEFARDVVKKRGYKKIRPGPTQGQRRLDYVNGKWLEYRYGWLPLISSIHSIGEAMRKRRETQLVYLKARSGQKKEETIRTGDRSFGNPEKIRYLNGSYRCEIGVLFDLPTGPQWSDWTSLNPAAIAWELVPFSFVADWFIGVGQCLENWENWFTYANNFVTGYKVSSYKETRSYQDNGYTSSPVQYWENGRPKDGTYLQFRHGVSFVHSTVYNRVVLHSLPMPGGPRLKNGLNSKRMLDSAALISQIVRKFR